MCGWTFAPTLPAGFARDGFELSWNLLNGNMITRDYASTVEAADAAYDPIIENERRKPSEPVWLVKSPDPERL